MRKCRIRSWRLAGVRVTRGTSVNSSRQAAARKAQRKNGVRNAKKKGVVSKAGGAKRLADCV